MTVVRKRHVFYLPGYDPIVPRRYRELYRKEAREQARIAGYEIEVAGRPGGERYQWDVVATMDGTTTRSTVEFMVWTDIVRDSMDRSIAASFLLLMRTVWIYLSTGALIRLIRLRYQPMLAALYPVAMLLLQLGLAYLAARLVFAGATLFAPDVLGLLAGATVIWFVMSWFKKQDGRLFAYYLLHDYAFSAQYYGKTPPELDARIDQFADRIGEVLKADVDEVLIVGHSSGAHIGVHVLARLDARGALLGKAIGFLSLGHVIPMVSFLPEANELRADIKRVCQLDSITWIDISAPADGACFALCDPVLTTGLKPENQLWPKVISAAFSHSLSPEKLRRNKYRFFRLHIQYLHAFDRPENYDYFAITAGPTTLRDRYKDRTHSKSRVTKAWSGYRET